MNIMVYYDGSPQSKRALETGISMGKNFNAELHLMTSSELYELTVNSADFYKEKDAGDSPDFVAEIGAVTQLVSEARLPYKIHMMDHGKSPGEHIVDFAAQLNAEYIVLGMKGRSRLHKIGYGRTAQFVVSHSPCPVMTVN